MNWWIDDTGGSNCPMILSPGAMRPWALLLPKHSHWNSWRSSNFCRKKRDYDTEILWHCCGGSTLSCEEFCINPDVIKRCNEKSMFLWILFKSTPSFLGFPIDTFDCRKVLMFSHGFYWYGPDYPRCYLLVHDLLRLDQGLCAEKRIAGLPLLPLVRYKY